MYTNNEYFKSESGTLGTRIDRAWERYNHKESSAKERWTALEFLVFAFDLQEIPDIHLRDQLALMMMEREMYKEHNPEYIPNQAPKFLKQVIDPKSRIIPKTTLLSSRQRKPIDRAITNQNLLDVNRRGRELDRKYNSNYFTPEERAKHRLMIRNGEFYHEGEKFDSSNLVAHGEEGYAAFTVNANGEISFFKHLCGKPDEDQEGEILFHSSMNAGSPVIAAGEFRIENGQLKEINTHSGHYRPSLFNVYRLLNHFQDKGVDLSNVEVLTFNKLPKEISKHCKLNSNYNMWQTPAKDVLGYFKQLFHENITALNEYKKGDFKNNFLRIIGYKLTVKRDKLAKQFSRDIDAIFQASHLEPDEKIAYMRELTELYIEKNNSYAERYGKEENSGKLGQVFCLFNQKLTETEEGQNELNEASESMLESYKGIF